VGRYKALRPGPRLVVLGGLHGNEPAGILAAERVLATLGRMDPARVRGEFVAVRGNRPAIAQSRRYVDRDINRLWTAERIELLGRGRLPDGESLTAEHRELLRLHRFLSPLLAPARQPRYFLDVHTSSADGPPFGLFSDTPANRAFALRLGVPMLTGLENYLIGITTEFFTRRGAVAAGIEAGQHDSPLAVDHAEGAIWGALFAAGMVAPRHAPEGRLAYERLAAKGRAIPSPLAVVHRHAIQPEDRYRTRPGFQNFDPVRGGQVIGRDRSGPVRTPRAGRIIMPLYQKQGEDGFFLAVPAGRGARLARRLAELLGRR
jgi:succinylglutamate desuccinylase